jgi:hypothetical protein
VYWHHEPMKWMCNKRSASSYPNGQCIERLIFLVQVTKSGEVFTDRTREAQQLCLQGCGHLQLGRRWNDRSAQRKVAFPRNSAAATTSHKELLPLLIPINPSSRRPQVRVSWSSARHIEVG